MKIFKNSKATLKNVGKRIPIIILAMLMIIGTFTACSDDNPGMTGGKVRISVDEWIGYQSILDANGGLTTGETQSLTTPIPCPMPIIALRR